MERLILENFRSASNGRSTRPHRLIKGFVPHYVDLVSEGDDSDFRDKVNPSYPLILGPNRTSVVTKASKQIAVMIDNPDYLSPYPKVIYSLNDWNLFSDDPTQTDLGKPASPASTLLIDAVFSNVHNRVYTCNAGSTTIYYKLVNDTGAYSSVSGAAASSPFRLEPFEDRILVLSPTAIRIVGNNQTMEGAPSSFVFAGIEKAVDIKNYQDKYALVFLSRSSNTPNPLAKDTQVIAWVPILPATGTTSNYEFKFTLKGRYKTSVKKDNTIYAFTQLGSTLVCSKYIGGAFQEVGRVKNVIVSELLSNPKMRVSVENDFFVLIATSPGNVTYASPFYWKPETGENFWLHDDASYAYEGAMVSQDSDGKYARYFAFNNNGTATLSKFTLENSSKSARALYKSGIIPIPAKKGSHMGRGQIKSIEIEWNELPTDVAAAEKLDITFKTKDEYTSQTVSSQSASCQATNALSSNARVSANRAIIPLGALCTEFEIEAQLTNTTNAWDLIIRRIIVNYEPVRLQQ